MAHQEGEEYDKKIPRGVAQEENAFVRRILPQAGPEEG